MKGLQSIEASIIFLHGLIILQSTAVQHPVNQKSRSFQRGYAFEQLFQNYSQDFSTLRFRGLGYFFTALVG